MSPWKLAAPIAVIVLLLTASTALAGGNGAQTVTIVVHDLTDTTPDVNPCTGDSGMTTVTVNGVMHETRLANGTYHMTFTGTGAFFFDADDSDAPDYTGRFTIWGGENSNNQNFAGSFTATIHVTGTDGSTLKFHETAHFSVSATGVLITFEKLRCG